MARIFFISDLHFDHRAITNYRDQFSSVEAHNEFIVDNILTTVNRKDTLWILGDICFSVDSLKYFREIRNHVNRLNVILGNHCTDSAERRQVAKVIMNEADQCHGMARLSGGYTLTHAPIHPYELRGTINVHGHVHDKTIPDDSYVNVCCENVNYKPISFQDIKAGWRGY